jgi:hypothetical protein
MSRLSPMALESATLEVDGATAHPAGSRPRDHALPRAIPLGIRAAGRAAGALLLAIGALAVVAAPLLALAMALTLLAAALVGPFLLLGVLALAYALLALGATIAGAAG